MSKASSARARSAELEGLAAGRIVQYQLPGTSKLVPAIVIEVHDPKAGEVSLVAFCPPATIAPGVQVPVHYARARFAPDPEDAPFGTWTWPATA